MTEPKITLRDATLFVLSIAATIAISLGVVETINTFWNMTLALAVAVEERGTK